MPFCKQPHIPRPPASACTCFAFLQAPVVRAILFSFLCPNSRACCLTLFPVPQQPLPASCTHAQRRRRPSTCAERVAILSTAPGLQQANAWCYFSKCLWCFERPQPRPIRPALSQAAPCPAKQHQPPQLHYQVPLRGVGEVSGQGAALCAPTASARLPLALQLAWLPQDLFPMALLSLVCVSSSQNCLSLNDPRSMYQPPYTPRATSPIAFFPTKRLISSMKLHLRCALRRNQSPMPLNSLIAPS